MDNAPWLADRKALVHQVFNMLRRDSNVCIVACPEFSSYDGDFTFKVKANDCGCDLLFDEAANQLSIRLRFMVVPGGEIIITPFVVFPVLPNGTTVRFGPILLIENINLLTKLFPASLKMQHPCL